MFPVRQGRRSAIPALGIGGHRTMTLSLRLALAGAGLALGLLAAGSASAATSPAMQSCSDQWAQLKADDKVPAGQTWSKFWSQCAKDYAAAHPADAAAAADKTAPPPAEPPPAKTKAAAKPATAPAPADDMAATSGKGKSPAMAACSDEWAKLKADGKVPAGQTWPKFWSQCAKDYAAAHPDEATPPKAKAAKATKADDEDLGAPLPDPEVAAKVDPNKPAVTGKREPTPGQKAAWARMRSCGAEWQAAKKAGTLATGAKWPQYWSDCNKRLKAKGQ
ncbi:hypothetical protein C3941_01890 [Kaistia algarum]|nr:hypothetical protein C3941_01890 [Kaistia algarum]